MQPDATSRISASATHGNRKNAAAPLRRGKDADRKRKKTKTVSQKLLEKVCRHNFFPFALPRFPRHIYTPSPRLSSRTGSRLFPYQEKPRDMTSKKDFFPKNLLRVQASPTGSATSENEFLKVGKKFASVNKNHEYCTENPLFALSDIQPESPAGPGAKMSQRTPDFRCKTNYSYIKTNQKNGRNPFPAARRQAATVSTVKELHTGPVKKHKTL